MIHILLNLTRPLFYIDAETTGLDRDTRIVELGFQRWEARGLTMEWRMLFNPGIPIPAGASDTHGITTEMINSCRRCGKPFSDFDHTGFSTCEFAAWPYFKQAAQRLAGGFTDCDYAGKNIRFDLRVLANEFVRVGVEWSYQGARILDIDRLEQIALPRTLSALYEKYTGEALEGAHGALEDVRASQVVMVKQFEAHSVLPRDLDELHKLLWPGWITADGSARFRNDVPVLTFGKHRDKPLQEIPIDYWNWVLSADFPADLKTLAAQAKLKKFPGVGQ